MPTAGATAAGATSVVATIVGVAIPIGSESSASNCSGQFGPESLFKVAIKFACRVVAEQIDLHSYRFTQHDLVQGLSLWLSIDSAV